MEKEIVRKRVHIDPEIVSNSYQHGNNSTKYCTYKKEKKSKVEVIGDKDLKSGYCFSDLLSMLKKNKDHNFIYYKMEEDQYQRVKLTKEEKCRWIDMCVEHEALPPYITTKSLDKKVIVVNANADNITPSLLFV
jgi:hypothetical protein